MLRLSEKNLGGDATVNGQTLKVTKEQIEAELKDINDSIADLSNRLDMRVFLDVLNGTSSPVTSDRVILATTNITNMDASIIRPGRFDVLLEFDYSNSKEIADLLCSIYKNNPKLSPEEFEDIKKTDFQAKRLTPAMIIGAAHILEPYQLIEICKQNDDFRDKYIDIHYYNDLVKRKSTKPK
jgi:SpoVK/Ycf46/Vps4 family AAA+-type ATPase